MDDAIIIGELQRYIHANIPVQHLYCPVTYKGNLVTDGCKRKHRNQQFRINLIADNIDDNETLLDLGCNTGFIINEIGLSKNIKATGVDNEKCLIELCELIQKYQLSRFTFILNDMYDFISACQRNNKLFDNIIMSSVFDFEKIMSMMNDLLSITNKRLFLEPTNHKLNTIEQINEKYIKPFKKLYTTKVLGHTDYQNRVMLMVTKDA